ncbi:glycosyltransferase family 2 protein [Streptacidiphilus melanogenes]|uniref:glycosyltransferase family 2 protein n=1 Tax=Streptacidiphilus melanogenes TaxID=411235 RepID=UPI0005A72609|nr:glycosyltransferase family 2 protein [Streptacidiphilus melanogenes]
MSTGKPLTMPPIPRSAADGVPLRRATDRPRTRSTVSLVIPAYNEARNIPWVFQEIPRCVDEVLLIDGDSHDATERMARLCRPATRILRQDAPGKGSALRTGFLAARCDYVVMLDADGSMWPGEIPHYIHFLDNGYDFVKGSRYIAGGGSQDLTTIRSFGNKVLVAATNLLYDAALTDLCYGFCAFRRSFLDELDLHAPGFEIETEMVAHALRSGLRVAEVPSLELPRRAGRSHLHALSDGRRVLRTLLAERPRTTEGVRRPVGAAAGTGETR